MANLSRTVFRIIQSILLELVLVGVFAFTVNKYLDYPEQPIVSDGVGYYDYLPSLFIHHDLDRKELDTNRNHTAYERIRNLPPDIYNRIDGRYVNKYTCGTALLESPFFLTTYAFSSQADNQNDGYQEQYQLTIYISTLFYLLLGLFFFRQFLKTYQLSKTTIFITEIVVLFSTNIVQYASYNASYSHIYSFFAISLFLYLSKHYFDTFKTKYIILMAGTLGLIFILRQVNILIIFSIPFIAGSWSNFKTGIMTLFRNSRGLIIGSGIALLFLFIQMLLWYYQTGSWIVYSYGKEGFRFLDPQLFNILFSFKRGLLIYTPILLLTIPGIYFMYRQEGRYSLLTWFVFTLLITYVLSSWWAWDYGASFSSRPFIDFYPLLFIPIAFLIQTIKRWVWLGIAPIIGFCIYLNYTQIYQINHFILHWFETNSTNYFKVFLETDKRYEGWIYKIEEPVDRYELLLKEALKKSNTDPYQSNKLLEITSDSTNRLFESSVLRITLNSDFPKDNEAQVVVEITDTETQTLTYWHSRYLLQFVDDHPGKQQLGKFDFVLPETTAHHPIQLKVTLLAGKQPFSIKNGTIEFYKK